MAMRNLVTSFRHIHFCRWRNDIIQGNIHLFLDNHHQFWILIPKLDSLKNEKLIMRIHLFTPKFKLFRVSVEHGWEITY